MKQGSTITAERAQTFDELGRIIKTIKGDASASWSFGYDKTDNLVRVTDPRSKDWSSGFDALNRLVSQTDPEPATVTATRNGVDEIATYKDPRNLTTTYVRNGFGDVIRQTNPDSGVTDYEYDARGLLTKKTRATGQVETFLYDAAGRMTRHAYAGSTVYDVDYTWDGTVSGDFGKGRITRVDDQAGYSTFAYDARGNVLTETRVNSGSPGSTTHVTQYEWDLADRLTGITYPSGRIVAYVRDAMGRVTSVTTKANASAASVTLASNITWRPMAGTQGILERGSSSPDVPNAPQVSDIFSSAEPTKVLPFLLAPDAMARNAMPITDGSAMNAGTSAQNAPLPGMEALTTDLLQSLTYGNGLIYSKEYDEDNRLKRWTVEQGATSVVRRKSISADGMNVTRLEDEFAGAQTEDLSYSASARLASASGSYGTRSWTYDKVGNRTAETKNGTASTWSYPSTNNRLTLVKEGGTTRRSFSYDAEGAITGDFRNPGGVHAFTYHPTGMLAQVKIGGVTQATYLYDGFNRLTTRNVLVGSPTGAVRHVWDVFGHIIAEAPYGGLGSREYVWLGDMPLAVFDGTASPATQASVHVDHLDRPVAMTDAGKAVTWSAAYEPFGKVVSVTGSATQNLGLPGQWFQLEAGLAYNWNRHYEPTLGRYTRPDPLGFVDGPSVYGYAGQSPAMRVDPAGLFEILGPSPGLWHGNGRVCGIIIGGYGCRLDYHANPCPSKLHFHFGPLGGGWGGHRPWYAPWKVY